ncbi:bifunctional hydroxymethylpyrimidine kinase/phosphomethylpyrimidine kinase [Desulfovulcanus sp.]
MKPKCILTIAGSDSGGGAGIQADLKTITVLGGYGLSVITALTAQNTKEVAGICAPDSGFVLKQLQTVLSDFPVAAAKTGMLFSSQIIEEVSKGLKDKEFPLVVDPVCVSGSGHKLLEEEALKKLKEKILPLADLLTPNRFEAEILSGVTSIQGEDELFLALEKLLALGPKAVLLKGGHFQGQEMVDWLAMKGKEPVSIKRSKVITQNTHGTGCTLSAAIATFLGQGFDLCCAVEKARDYLQLTLKAGFDLGAGNGPVNHLASLTKLECKEKVIKQLVEVRKEILKRENFHLLIPEVRMNIALALPWPEKIKDVAAFEGRIFNTSDGQVIIGWPAFGASSHMAKVVLAANRINPKIHCAANIRYTQQIVEAVEKAGFTMAWFDRQNEPKDLKEKEGSTLEWGTYAALSDHPHPEQVVAIADKGEVGKEPMIRIIGEDTKDVMRKLDMVIRVLSL